MLGGTAEAGRSGAPRVSPLRQFGILARRYFDLIAHDRRNLLILLLQAPIIGLLLMLVANSDAIVGDKAFASEAKKVLFMLATVAVWFGIINAAREIVKEAPIYRRERLANLRIGPYLFSKVLILTLHTEEEQLIPLLEDGASGFLSKHTAQTELVEAIRVVAAGDVFVRSSAARLLAANARPQPRKSPVDEARSQLAQLSGREQSVLRYVAEGYSGVEIGRILGVTSKSVDTYKNRIAQKLGFTHRTDYVRFALRLGLIGAAPGQRITDSVSRLRRQPAV